MTNRKLNETVGGMQMLGGSANQLTEYLIRTLVETWVEPVLRQLVKLEQAYETDKTILGLAGEKASGILQKYGINQVTDELLDQELTVTVNVGMGATDPQTKLQKFTHAMASYGQIMSTMQDVDPEAVRKELFGLAGYKDGTRFFQKAGDPNEAKLQQAAQLAEQMQGVIQNLQAQLKQVSENKQADNLVKIADSDLKQAQTVKTLQEALIVPDMALMKQAQEPAGA
jgi:hypothetical protein